MRFCFVLYGLVLCVGGRAQLPQRYDVVISEIMADPLPRVGLPAAEFVELHNRSGRLLTLTGWRLATATALSGAFPVQVLKPDSFLLLTSTTNAPLFRDYGAVLGLPSFPSLDNDGALLSLVSREGITIHAVGYTSGWYGNAVKKEGGWTLEMIDLTHPCRGAANWKASTNALGGTPGRINAVAAANQDDEPPRLLRGFCPDSLTVKLFFDEAMDSASAAIATHYRINGIPVAAALPQGPLYEEVILRLATPLQRQKLYEVVVDGLEDCSHNLIGIYHTKKLGWASVPVPHDIIINEILFDPKPGGYDYVELFNRGSTTVDASQLYLATRDAAGAVNGIKRITETGFAILPGDYIVATPDVAALRRNYFVAQPEQVLTMSLPSYPDDKGTVVLLNAQGLVIDEVTYAAKWHFALITDPEGIALERLDPSGASNDPRNWHSAASTSGFGTPTAPNSQYRNSTPGGAPIFVSPLVISPDNDGRDDVAIIAYEMQAPGFAASLTIFDSGGNAVRALARNELLGIRGSWVWDGLGDNGRALPVGIYIIYASLFDLQGKRQQYKLTVVLAQKR